MIVLICLDIFLFLVSAVKPCRHLCEDSRRGCEPIMKNFNKSWPQQFDCSRYPLSEPCFSAPGKNTKKKISSIYDEHYSCSYEYRTIESEFKYKLDGVMNCAMPCNRSLFTNKQIYIVRHYVGILAILCLLSTLFTIITYSIDLARYRYPERPNIIFIYMLFYSCMCICGRLC